MGSVNGTIKDIIDEMRDDGVADRPGHAGLLPPVPDRRRCARSWCARKHVVVIEKSFAVGMGGPLANNVDLALRNVAGAPQVHSVIAGLGGRPITRASLHKAFRGAVGAAVGRLAVPRSQ